MGKGAIGRRHGRSSFGTQRSVVFALLAVVCIAVTLLLLFSTEGPQAGARMANDEQLLKEFEVWPMMAKAALASGEMAVDVNALDHRLLTECWKSPDWLKLYADPMCTMLWMRVLAHEDMYAADNILAVVTNKERKEDGVDAKSQQNGGMRGFFSGGAGSLEMKGYWKPCGGRDLKGNKESFLGEIVAFHIDRIIGFYRTPAVVPRIMRDKKLEFLAEAGHNSTNAAKNLESVHSILDRCGSEGGKYAEGAVVGWANKEVELLIRRKKKEPFFVDFFKLTEETVDAERHKFDLTPTSSTGAIQFALENVAVNMFAVLTNNYNRFNHNLFIMKRPSARTGGDEYGPFIYLDNDRSKWKYDPIEEGKIAQDNAFSQFCVFPRHMAHRLLLLRPGYATSDPLGAEGVGDPEVQKMTLGQVVMKSTRVYGVMQHGLIFDQRQAAFLDMSAKVMTDAIVDCVKRYGEENVLFDEPWRQSTEYDTLGSIMAVLASGVR